MASTGNQQLAVHLNNMAVSFLTFQNLNKAFELLREALFQTICVVDPHCSETVDALVADRTTKSGPILYQSLAVKDSAYQDTEEKRTGCSCASITFVYSDGIRLLPSGIAFSCDNLVNEIAVSSIIIFNLGVAYHVNGLETYSGPQLTKSLSMYQKAYVLLLDVGIPPMPTGNAMVDLLFMALFNNLAHVCFELVNYEESERYFDSLYRFAYAISPIFYDDPAARDAIEQHKRNFLLNAVILKTPNFANAA